MGVLCLVPIYIGVRAELLSPLAEMLTRIFDLPVEKHLPDFDPEVAFDSSRGQYNSRVLLAQLLRGIPTSASRVLGVTTVDLFIPVLTYVFGEAQLDGQAAIVSTHRLDPKLYGLPPDPGLLLGRLCKESIHELGHTYNLVHCHRDACVMLSSTYVEDIDLKSDRFCRSCLQWLRDRGAQTANGASSGNCC
jgi:archaemetzincin